MRLGRTDAEVWQYRDADPHFGSWQAKELSSHLKAGGAPGFFRFFLFDHFLFFVFFFFWGGGKVFRRRRVGSD